MGINLALTQKLMNIKWTWLKRRSKISQLSRKINKNQKKLFSMKQHVTPIMFQLIRNPHHRTAPPSLIITTYKDLSLSKMNRSRSRRSKSKSKKDQIWPETTKSITKVIKIVAWGKKYLSWIKIKVRPLRPFPPAQRPASRMIWMGTPMAMTNQIQSSHIWKIKEDKKTSQI